MKKLLLCCLIGTMAMSFTACGSKNNATNEVKNEVNVTENEIDQPNEEGVFGTLSEMPAFEVKDINDQVVTNAIFEDQKLTFINIWGTFCKPCLDEMPILQELYTEYKEQGVNVVGVVSDGEVNDIKALEILKQSKAEFTNLIPNEAFMKDFVSQTDVVPVTLIVNSEGKILEVAAGARDKEGYKALIDKHLSEIK